MKKRLLTIGLPVLLLTINAASGIPAWEDTAAADTAAEVPAAEDTATAEVYTASAAPAAETVSVTPAAETATTEDSVDALSDMKKLLDVDGLDESANEKAYVTLKEVKVYETPDENGTVAGSLHFESKVEAVPSERAGWSEITANDDSGERIHGYVTDSSLSNTSNITAVKEYMTVDADSEVFDYPGQRDGDVIGEVLEYDEVELTGLIGDAWGRILFLDDQMEEKEGYILAGSLDGAEELAARITQVNDEHSEENAAAAADAEKVDAGYISVSDGQGIFAVAEDNITAGVTENSYGVRVGDPVAVSSDAKLIPLGTFRITHYCPCAICNGPYINGATSTGAVATTNHTIAVDPTQIPYGSRVVINGQVYVAEDCGGGIKTNCIDIYVETHEECDAKGVFYTDVYLLQE